MEEVKDKMGIELNTSNVQNRAPEAEHNDRTLKEAFGMALHCMPHERMPKTVITNLIRSCTEWLNWFPAEHGISKCCSPLTTVTGRMSDFKKHCKCEFGTCAQASNQNAPVNGVQECAIDGIHSRPANDAQGGHNVHDT